MTVKTVTTKPNNNRGTRHLRVRLELRKRTTRVAAVWLVNEPVIQLEQFRKPFIAQTNIGNNTSDPPTLVQAFDDPRIIRGSHKPHVGHSYQVEATGMITVSVPFTQLSDLNSMTVNVADRTNLPQGVLNVEAANAIFDRPPTKMKAIRTVDTAAIKSHNDWPKVATSLGLSVTKGNFEVYIDRAGKFRWRLKRPGGEIVADSGQGYKTRDALEADLRWIKQHAAVSKILRLDK